MAERTLLDVARAGTRTYLRTRNIPAQYHDDVLSDACLGAAQAAATYDPAKGASLTAHAATRVRGEILEGARKRSPVSRHHYARGVTYGSLPAHRRVPMSLEGLSELAHEPTAPGSMEETVADADLVARMLASCTERERIILSANVLHGYALADVADYLGVSPSLISRQRTAVLARLRAQFAGAWQDAA